MIEKYVNKINDNIVQSVTFEQFIHSWEMNRLRPLVGWYGKNFTMSKLKLEHNYEYTFGYCFDQARREGWNIE